MIRSENGQEGGESNEMKDPDESDTESSNQNMDGFSDRNKKGLGAGDFRSRTIREETEDEESNFFANGNYTRSEKEENENFGEQRKYSTHEEEGYGRQDFQYGDGLSREGGNRRFTSNDEPKPNLIVNYLPQSFMDREFFHLFAPYGAMESIKIMRDSQTGYSFGYGFVNYIELQDAIDARNELNGLQLGHKRIKVSFARPPSDDIKDTNLFVTGLPTSITEEELDQMFSPFGVIVHLRVLRDRQTKTTRGVAFVRYETRSEACAAILEMNGIVPNCATDPIRVRLAQDHGKQKAAYLAGYQAALKMKVPNVGGIRVSDAPYRHSETSFNLHSRNLMHQNRGRPMTACVGDGIRVTTSTSDPTLYWKGFLQGSRDPRRPETSGGRNPDRRPNSRSSNTRF